MLGINILAQFVADRQMLLFWLTQLKPSAVLVMDDTGLAVEIKRLLPECIVIHRSYTMDEAEYPSRWTPQRFVDTFCRNVSAGIIVQCANEPNGYGDLTAKSQWFAETMDLSPAPLAVPAFGVGHPKEDFGSELDSMLYAFARNPEHILLLHEYFQFDPIAEQPYHIGRFKTLVTRFNQLQLPVPTIVMGEAGRDVGGGINDGWSAVFDEPTYSAKLAQQANIYKNTAVKGMCVFCYGKGGGDSWRSFDIEHANIVKQSMIDYNRSNPPMTQLPKPDLTPLHAATVTSAPTLGANVRNAADTNGAILRQLFTGDPIQISTDFFTNDGYNWYQVGAGEYVADTSAFAWADEPPPPPPDDDLAQARALLHDALGQLEILQENVAELTVIMQNLKTRMDAL